MKPLSAQFYPGQNRPARPEPVTPEEWAEYIFRLTNASLSYEFLLTGDYACYADIGEHEPGDPSTPRERIAVASSPNEGWHRLAREIAKSRGMPYPEEPTHG